MYLSAEAVTYAIRRLRNTVHPFFGITFVACKWANLSVGDADYVSMDTLTKEHLDRYHVLDRSSRYYFQPFKSTKEWVARKYPSSGLQAINTQTFADVFIHPRNSDQWSFSEDYVEHIVRILRTSPGHSSRASATALAIWLYKTTILDEQSNLTDLVNRFFREFNITGDEFEKLFDEDSVGFDGYLRGSPFSDEPLALVDVAEQFSAPPDAAQDNGSTIASLRLRNIGPAKELAMDLGERLSLVTGDNGLGKSFLLEFAWWATTGAWSDKAAYPLVADRKVEPSVHYTMRTGRSRTVSFYSQFNIKTFSWVNQGKRPTVAALSIFSRADGSFAVSDPIRSRLQASDGSLIGKFSPQEVWNGQPGSIEGLIRDWAKWERAADRLPFDRFAAALKQLSPEDLGVLRPGPTIRIPGDPRDIPTISHNYGDVPVIHASSGVQRILLLAYLIIWAWQEHEVAAQQLDVPPLRRMVVIVDELEAHLHPKWQRTVLPALMSIGKLLSSDLVIQTLAATHSPMVLASVESMFDTDQDVLYHLFTNEGQVLLEPLNFVRYGDVSAWLQSPLFGLRHARSKEGERAIEAAKALQLQSEPSPEQVVEVSDALRRYLAPDDKFWPRWIYFAETHGVQL